MKWIYCILLSLGGSLELAQHMLEEVRMRPWSANIIIPQSRVLAAPRTQKVQMTHIRVFVSISHQVATTTMEIDLKNPTSQAQEAELLVPIPAQVVVRSFTFQGNGPEASAQLLPKKEAEALYRSIVSQLRDPALLEFLEYNVLRSSVFPVEAHGTQKIRLTYEQFLKAEGSRVDYLLPRTESIEYQVPWEVSVQIQTPHPLSTVYSPSHKLELLRLSPTQILAKIAPEAQKEPGTFFLSYLTKQEEITASLYSYPHPQSGGGYFLLFAGLPPQTPQELKAIKREVLLVFDRSGSMHSEKLDQIRSAALQIISGLEEDETFNILIYNEYVDFFSPHSLPPTPENLKAAQQFLKAVRAQGGTNIHDALLESLRQKPKAGALSFVLFLTDGLPTIGQTSEIRIRQMALKANIYQKRIFTFGVGVDVNTPLLEQVSGESRGSASFVLPKEDVEIKVSQVFKRLCGPILADPSLEFLDENAQTAKGRVINLIPSPLPDLFEGDQLVLLGQYLGEEPLTFRLHGNFLGKKKSFLFPFQFNKTSTRNAFVPRLWASRKIAFLVEQIRQLGADSLPAPEKIQNATKLQELLNEVLRLSSEFGILSEYTAFLAREGTNLSEKNKILEEAGRNFVNRAWHCRSGWGSVNQELNNQFQKKQSYLNYKNIYLDEQMNEVTISHIQQIQDRTFYQRKDCWIDSRILEKYPKLQPTRIIPFASEAYYQLALRLAQEGRSGCLAFQGDILLLVDGDLILVDCP